MHIGVLGSPTSWYLADLSRAAADRHRVSSATFRNIHSSLAAERVAVGSGQTSLDACDAVLVRSMAGGSLEQVVFRMDALAQLAATGVTVVNPPRAIEVAVDKYLATARLREAGLLVPTTFACQTATDAMHAMQQLGGRAVLKPVFGGEGRGITMLDDPAMAQRAFSLLEGLGGVILLQEYIEHQGFDLRLLVIGQRVFGMRRVNPHDWRTNISRGAKAEPLEVTPELSEIALRAAAAVGAPLSGVDLLPGRDGKLYAIEVNAVPGWRALGRATGVDVAARVIELLEQAT